MNTSLTVEGDGWDELPGGRFTFYVEVPTLESMASIRVALAIWYGYVSRSESVLSELYEFANSIKFFMSATTRRITMEHYTGIYSTIFAETEKLPEVLKTPRSVEEMIKKSLENVICECWAWMQHLTAMFRGRLFTYRIKCIDLNWWMWMSNGTIDYQKTDMTMLSSEKLDEEQRFVVRGRHCLEDEMAAVNLAALNTMLNFIYRDPLLEFWKWRVDIELNQLEISPSYADTARLLEAADCFAFDHFWHQLNETDRESTIKEWILKCEGVVAWIIIERLFSSLSYTQQLRVLSRKPVDITVKFIIFSQSLKSAFWPWQHIKDSIEEYQFACLVYEIFQKVRYIEERTSLLIELWNTPACDRYKKFAAQNLTERMYEWPVNCCPEFLEFYYEIFRLLPKRTLIELILENKFLLVKSHDVNFCKKVLDLCSSSPEDRLKLIRSIFEPDGVENSLVSSIAHGNIEDFCDVCEWSFVQDLICGATFKKKILRKLHIENLSRIPMLTIINVVTNIDKWKHFCKFIDEAFPDDEHSALLEKRWWIFFLAEKRHSYFFKVHVITKCDELIKVIETVFVGEELRRLKRSFCKLLFKYKENGVKSNDEEVLSAQKFINWCRCDAE